MKETLNRTSDHQHASTPKWVTKNLNQIHKNNGKETLSTHI